MMITSRVNAGSLILVNRHNPILSQPPTFEGTLVPVAENILLDKNAAAAYKHIMDAINAWGLIVPVSGWRSKAEQEAIYNGSLRENGLDFTRKYVAFPGHSEHQTGLAVDLALNQPDIDFLCPSFPYDGICGVFREKAAQYGFVERYPRGKEDITGIAHEPWHFRYVGAPHAEIMKSRGITLEEYHLLRQ